MTGFGRATNRGKSAAQAVAAGESASDAASIDVSVRAVNGRFLEMRFHLPREYAGLEADFKSQLSKTFARGTVDIYVNRVAAQTHASVEANEELAKQYLAAHAKLAKATGLKQEATLDWLSRQADVLTIRQTDELSASEQQEAKRLVEEAAKACDTERTREGKALAQELEKYCANLEDLSKKIEALKSEAKVDLEQRYKDRLTTGLHKFGAGQHIDEQRIAQEIVIQLDRADISEEIQRLGEHIKAYRQLLKSGDPQGKKLDFYAQELLREVNTIGSKSHIAKLTALVVEAKTLVERIREQVQNCE